MSVAHTPSRHDPCTTGTDAALSARPCGVWMWKRRHARVARQGAYPCPTLGHSHRNGKQQGILPPAALLTEWCNRVVCPHVGPGRSSSCRADCVRPQSCNVRAISHRACKCIFRFSPHQAGPQRNAHFLTTFCARQEPVSSFAAGESPVSSFAPLISRGSGERHRLGEERLPCLCMSTPVRPQGRLSPTSSRAKEGTHVVGARAYSSGTTLQSKCHHTSRTGRSLGVSSRPHQAPPASPEGPLTRQYDSPTQVAHPS
jgi:hypothetical protein